MEHDSHEEECSGDDEHCGSSEEEHDHEEHDHEEEEEHFHDNHHSEEDCERDELSEFLKKDKVFSQLSPESYTKALLAFERVLVPQSEAIFRQGALLADFFMLVSGESEVYVESSGAMRLQQTTGPGNGFGAAAAVNDKPCTATVIAKTNCKFWRLRRSLFKIFYEEVTNANRASPLLGPRQRSLQQEGSGTSSPMRRRTSNLKDFDASADTAPPEERKRQRKKSWALLKHYVAKEKEAINSQHSAPSAHAHRSHKGHSHLGRRKSNIARVETVPISILRVATGEEKGIEFAVNNTAAEIKDSIRAEFGLPPCSVIRLLDEKGERVMVSKRLPPAKYYFHEQSDEKGSSEHALVITYEGRAITINISPSDSADDIRDMLRHEFDLPSEMSVRLVTTSGRGAVISAKLPPGNYRLFTGPSNFSPADDTADDLVVRGRGAATAGSSAQISSERVIIITHGDRDTREVLFHSDDTAEEIKEAILNEFGLGSSTAIRLTNEANRGVVINGKLRPGSYSLFIVGQSAGILQQSPGETGVTLLEISGAGDGGEGLEHVIEISRGGESSADVRETIRETFGLSKSATFRLVNAQGHGVVISPRLMSGKYRLVCPTAAGSVAQDAVSAVQDAAEDAEQALGDVLRLRSEVEIIATDSENLFEQQKLAKVAAEAVEWARIAKENARLAREKEDEIACDVALATEAARDAQHIADGLRDFVTGELGTIEEAALTELHDMSSRAFETAERATRAAELATESLEIAVRATRRATVVEKESEGIASERLRAEGDTEDGKRALVDQALVAVEEAEEARRVSEKNANECVSIEAAVRLLGSDNSLVAEIASHVQAAVTSSIDCSKAAISARSIAEKLQRAEDITSIMLESAAANAESERAVAAMKENTAALQAALHVAGVLRQRTLTAASAKALLAVSIADAAVAQSESSLKSAEQALAIAQTLTDAHRGESVSQLEVCLQSALRAHEQVLLAKKNCGEFASSVTEDADPDSAAKHASKALDAAKVAETMADGVAAIAASSLQTTGAIQKEAAALTVTNALAVGKLREEAESASDKAMKIEIECRDALRSAQCISQCLASHNHIPFDVRDQMNVFLETIVKECAKAEVASHAAVRAATKATSSNQILAVETSTLEAMNHAAQSQACADKLVSALAEMKLLELRSRDDAAAAAHRTQTQKANSITKMVFESEDLLARAKVAYKSCVRHSDSVSSLAAEISSYKPENPAVENFSEEILRDPKKSVGALSNLAIQACAVAMEAANNSEKSYSAAKQAARAIKLCKNPTSAAMCLSVVKAATIAAESAIAHAPPLFSQLTEAFEALRGYTPIDIAPAPPTPPPAPPAPPSIGVDELKTYVLAETEKMQALFSSQVTTMQRNFEVESKLLRDQLDACTAELSRQKDFTEKSPVRTDETVAIPTEACDTEKALGSITGLLADAQIAHDSIISAKTSVEGLGVPFATAQMELVVALASPLLQSIATAHTHLSDPLPPPTAGEVAALVSQSSQNLALLHSLATLSLSLSLSSSDALQTIPSSPAAGISSEYLQSMIEQMKFEILNSPPPHSNADDFARIEAKLAEISGLVTNSYHNANAAQLHAEKAAEMVAVALQAQKIIRMENEEENKKLATSIQDHAEILITEAVERAVGKRLNVDIQKEAKSIALALMESTNLSESLTAAAAQIETAKAACELASLSAKDSADFAFANGPYADTYLPREGKAREMRVDLLKFVSAADGIDPTNFTLNALAKNRSHDQILNSLKGMIHDQRNLKEISAAEVLTHAAPSPVTSRFSPTSGRDPRLTQSTSSHSCVGTSQTWDDSILAEYMRQQEAKRRDGSDLGRMLSLERQRMDLTISNSGLGQAQSPLSVSCSSLPRSSTPHLPSRSSTPSLLGRAATPSQDKFGHVGLGGTLSHSRR